MLRLRLGYRTRTLLLLSLSWLVVVGATWGIGSIIMAVGPIGSFEQGVVASATAWVRETGMLREATVVITHLGDVTIVAVGALVLATVFALRGRHRAAVGLLIAVAGAWLARGAVKALVGRERPDVDALVEAAGSSFPSGHATLIAALCFGAVWLSPRGGTVRITAPIVAGLTIAAVAVSRIAVGVHHPTDIVAGVALGAAWAMITSRLLLVEDPASLPEIRTAHA